MGTPCKQEPIIRVMDSRQVAMDDKLERIVTALEHLTEQRIEIKHLSDGLADHHTWLKKHEERLQAVEKTPVSEHCATLKDHERRLQSQERKPDQSKEVDAVKERVDELEKKPAKSASKVAWMFYGAALSAGGSVISGLVVFWMIH